MNEIDGNYILTKDLLPEDLQTIMEIARQTLTRELAAIPDDFQLAIERLDISDEECIRLLKLLEEKLNGQRN